MRTINQNIPAILGRTKTTPPVGTAKTHWSGRIIIEGWGLSPKQITETKD